MYGYCSLVIYHQTNPHPPRCPLLRASLELMVSSLVPIPKLLASTSTVSMFSTLAVGDVYVFLFMVFLFMVFLFMVLLYQDLSAVHDVDAFTGLFHAASCQVIDQLRTVEFYFLNLRSAFGAETDRFRRCGG